VGTLFSLKKAVRELGHPSLHSSEVAINEERNVPQDLPQFDI
jgi:hypothetical protein